MTRGSQEETSGGVQSVARAFALLDLMSVEGGEMSLQRARRRVRYRCRRYIA